jgi:hypothetical protein
MAITKKYQLLKSMSLLAWFKVMGKVVSVSFQGGTRRPYLVRGRFSTSDPLLQKAIEESGNFGREYFLEAAFDNGVNVNSAETKQKEKPADKKDDPPAESNKKEDANQVTTDFPDITTVKDARQKLLDLYPDELKPSQLPNKPAVLVKAKAKNITFSNLA